MEEETTRTQVEYEEVDSANGISSHIETKNDESEYDLERRLEEEFDDTLMKVVTALKRYADRNALPLCENLSVNSLRKFVEN